MRQIYLDYNATTPVAPPVADAIQEFVGGYFGNPSSSHALGRAAKEAISDARSKVALLLNCEPGEVVFTSGGTESNNHAMKGVMLRHAPQDAHLIISAIEHPAIVEPANFLKRQGYEISVVGCDENGVVNPDSVADAIRPNTRLVSVMHANNEIGTIQPIKKIADVCHQRGVLLHTDASQSVGKIPTCVQALRVDLLTVAGHKLYAPKGVGALFVQDGLEIEPLMHGAAHENGRRAGTENTPYIVGLGEAANLARQNLSESAEKLSDLRDRLADLLSEAIPGIQVNGANVERLPNTLSVRFPVISGQELLARSNELCASTGSACHSSGQVVSATLASMGQSPEQVKGTVRLSLGWYSSNEEIERAANLLADAWENLTTAVQ